MPNSLLFSPFTPSTSPFNFTITNSNNTTKIKPCCFASKNTSLSIKATKLKTPEKNSKLRVMKLADKIRTTPEKERSKTVDSIIKEQCESKTVDNFNDIIMGLVVAKEFDHALKLFDEMSTLHGLLPDHWTYCIVIRCYCKKNQPEEGKRVLDCMIENGFRPNLVTVNMLVNSLSLSGRVQRGIEVLEMMVEIGCNPNIYTYNPILKGLCFVGRVEEAYKMLMDLKKLEGKFGVIPTMFSYNVVMDGFCKVGRTDEAMELLEEAINVGLTPNVYTYNALFVGYCKEGNPRKGIELLKQMNEKSCVPDYISYNTLLHGLLQWRYFMEAYWVYGEMVEVGLKVDEMKMNTMLKGFCRKSWEQEEMLEIVHQVFEKMKSWQYPVLADTYYMVIHTFCTGKKIDMALITMHEMVANGYFPNTNAVNHIIGGLCDEGKISQALSVLVLVCEGGKIPSKTSFNILIRKLNKQGNVLGACSVYGSALKLGVIPHNIPLLAARLSVDQTDPMYR